MALEKALADAGTALTVVVMPVSCATKGALIMLTASASISRRGTTGSMPLSTVASASSAKPFSCRSGPSTSTRTVVPLSGWPSARIVDSEKAI
jgi:hypothetical protein